MRIQIIGIGEIGQAISIAMLNEKSGNDYRYVDVVEKEFGMFGMKTQTEIVEADVHIISVYTTDQVFDVLEKIPKKNNPLISIESTIDPDRILDLAGWCMANDIVIFPHRFVPGDPNKHCFNLDRVMGADNVNSLLRGYKFWKPYFKRSGNRIKLTTFESAVMVKVVENAYRFMEIAIAEQLKITCFAKDLNFDEIREAANTKWNINILEARDGIGGKCLPKDCKLLAGICGPVNLFSQAIKVDEGYKEAFGGEK